MGNYNTTASTPLKRHWGKDNVQTFMVKGHKNKIFGCDVILPHMDNNNELWIASCSADGMLMIHEVLIETLPQKQFRRKIISSQSSCSLKSKSLSSIQVPSTKSVSAKKRVKKSKAIKPFEIEINRLMSIRLDSTICYTLSLHPNCRYVSTSIDRSLFIYDIDFNAGEAPIYNEVQIAKEYISGARFIDDIHIVFSSGDGNIYIYNFIQRKLIAKIANKRNKSRDILCFDYAVLKLPAKYNQNDAQLIVFGTLDGRILIYDISEIIENDLEIYNKPRQKQKQSGTNIKAVLLQKMSAQFGGEISCISLSADGKFIVVGAEDNSYNLYNVSILEDDDANIVDLQWVLLCKQIVKNDANVVDVAWIDNKTFIVSCDRTNEMYLSRMYDVRESEKAIQLIVDTMCVYNKNVTQFYDAKSNEMRHIMCYIVDIILEYVMWIILHHEMSAHFDEKISCLATCPKVNNAAGFIVVGGFSKLLQCFLPLQNLK